MLEIKETIIHSVREQSIESNTLFAADNR